jgi:Mn2+/Fe2+ NRAMP family transporter
MKRIFSFLQQKPTSPIMAAAFLMATSAIGPGFLTQTAVFTNNLLASFGFVILISIILDIGAQLNIWRVLTVSGMRAQELANKMYPGAGYLLTLFIVIGGLAFNTGNLAGAGLGMNALTGMSTETGAIISAVIAIIIFSYKKSLSLMDIFTKILGMIMIFLTLYVVFVAKPPMGDAIKKTFLPDKIDFYAIITLVGGTVGGYISFAGAHRLLDAGLIGRRNIKKVTQSATSGILIAAVMRVLLFLAALGVIAQGNIIDMKNPSASVFQLAAGNIGFKLFGIVMWSAAITSIVGAAYTSISFFKGFHQFFVKYERLLLVFFVLIPLAVFLMVGRPVSTLLFVGALNGFILPLALAIILMASSNEMIVGEYKHPLWLKIFGIAVVLSTLFLSVVTLARM